MNRSRIIPGTREHALEMAPRMRQADVDEIYAATGESPEKSLVNAVRVSSSCWAGQIDDVTICMFGVTPISLLMRKGCPWMLGTDLVEEHARTFLRHSRFIVSEMHKNYDFLQNWVDERNKRSINWLKWLGFSLEKAEPWGYEKRPFHKFSKMDGSSVLR